MQLRKNGLCPHCGKQLYTEKGGKLGRKLVAFYTVDGITKHLEDWADQFQVSVTTVNYYIYKKRLTMKQIVERYANPKYIKRGPANG